MDMANEPKQRDESEQERARRRREEEKPQTWKHPDDGTRAFRAGPGTPAQALI